MERLKTLRDMFIGCAQSQMGNLEDVDTHELGEVIDMIKDLEEAIYYHSIVDAMENNNIYEQKTPYDYQRDLNYNRGQMYYTEPHLNREYINHPEYPQELRDYREGRSPMGRRGYMEAKEKHQSKDMQMHELERYLNELAQDIAEMIDDASPEEKNMLQQKLNVLSAKIN